MKKALFFALVCAACLSAKAQTLVPVTWDAYGLIMDVPEGMQVEEDTDEGFQLSDNQFYLTLQALDSDGLATDDLPGILEDYATDDGIQDLSKVETIELPQYHVVYISGTCEEDACYSAILFEKETGVGFYVSLIYSEGQEAIAQKILNSFRLEH